MTDLMTPVVPAHNRWVLWLLSSPTGRHLVPGLGAVRFAGRRTGRTVILPVAIAWCGTDVTVLVGHHDAKRWWRNFVGGHPAELLLDGEWRTAHGEVVTAERIDHPRLRTGYRAAHPHTPPHTTEPIVHFVLTGPPTNGPPTNGPPR